MSSGVCRLGCYAIADRSSFANVKGLLTGVEHAAKAGASCIQLTDRQNTVNVAVALAQRVKKVIGDVPLIVNTRWPIEVAARAGAQGTFLEEEGLCPEAVRWVLRRTLIGMPVKTQKEVEAVNACPSINYVGVFLSGNDLDALRQARAICHRRIVAFGATAHRYEDVSAILNEGDGLAVALTEGANSGDAVRKVLAVRKRTLENRCAMWAP